MRSQFITKTGVIAATVGSAVGLGNIWRFPYEAGTHGGAAFIIIYALCVFLIGVPVMLAEFACGRGTHRSGVGAISTLSKKPFWRIIAYMGILSSVLILSFYSVVAGWIMEYMWQSAASLFSTSNPQEYASRFAQFISNPWRPALWTVLFLLANLLVLRRGIEKGIEKIGNILMPCLALLLIVFCVNSLLMPGAGEGLAFLFHPDFSALTPKVVIGAMGQAFFTLSLGLTCMLTYASYFSDKTPLVRSAMLTATLDTVVALVSGMIIFPAVFSYGLEPEAGPKLVFETLPSIFAQMPGGHLWSLAFFLLLFFASLTSTISMSEIAISYLCEERKMKRTSAAMLNTGVCMVLGVLCALSFGPLAQIKVFGLTLFNLFDGATSNVLLPLGGVLMSLFAGWATPGIIRRQLGAAAPVLLPLLRWVCPAAILIILIAA